jgi:hypothetical protein
LKFLEAIEIFIFNNSDAPGPAVSVKVSSGTRKRSVTSEVAVESEAEAPADPFKAVLRPADRSIPSKKQVSHHFAIVKPPSFPAHAKVSVYFRDVDNSIWHKSLSDGRLKMPSEKAAVKRNVNV